MKPTIKMAELMHVVSDIMLTLSPAGRFRAMQRALLGQRPAEPTMPRTDSVSNRSSSDLPTGVDRRGSTPLAWPYEETGDTADDTETAAHHARMELAEGAKFLEGSVTNHAGSRGYKLYVPSSYRGQPLPLVVMLHGCKQDPDDFAVGTRMNQIAEEKQCLVVYPAQARLASRPQCWNWFYPINQRRGFGEPSLIADITREVMRNYHVDERRVYVAGLSAGGAMAATMATTYPDMFAAAAVHSGMPYSAARDLYSAISAMKHGPRERRRKEDAVLEGAQASPGVPIIVFHGDADYVVHSSNGEQVVRQAVSAHNERAAGADADPATVSSVIQRELPEGRSYTRTLHHDEFGQNVAEHWLIHGGGHAWAGGCRDGSFTDPQGPDATNEMMRFFYEQALPEHRDGEAGNRVSAGHHAD